MIVVKIGGSEGINLDHVCDDVAELVADGTRLVLVHGGSHLTNEVASALGHPPQFVISPSGYTSRLTDRRTLEIFEMVYCGQVNKGIVERLQQRGINAIGLSGLDARLWQGKRKSAIRVVENGRQRIIRNNLTGTVTNVNTQLLNNLLDAGYLPVLTPPAITADGIAINVDGDRAAAQTAVALHAQHLLLLSNVAGVLSHFPDEGSLIRHLPITELDIVRQEAAQGRMRIKLLGAEEAIHGGIPRVTIGSAVGAQPITNALHGAGTQIFGVGIEPAEMSTSHFDRLSEQVQGEPS